MKMYSIKELNAMTIKECIDCEADRHINTMVHDIMTIKRGLREPERPEQENTINGIETGALRKRR
jgi:hypothetical protein